MRYKPVHAWFSVSKKTHVRDFVDSFYQCVLWLNDTCYNKSIWKDK